MKNNEVTIVGTVVADGFTYSHEVYGEKFYIVDILARRNSGVYDVIPIMVSERLMDISKSYKGAVWMVTGQFRSYNKHEGEKNHLVLTVFATDIECLDDATEDMNVNHIFLDGYVCKKPVYRKTPLGREIADVLLTVNRPYGKTSYIPCICWGRNARYAGKFEVGVHIRVSGRIQSREYEKKLDDGSVEKKTVYEVSVGKIEMVEEDEQ